MYLKCGTVIWLLLVSLYVVSAQFDCLTPYNTYGRCVPSNQCEFLNKLFRQYGLSLPEQFRKDVLQARCYGPDSSQIYLCCESAFSRPVTPTRPARPTPEPTRTLRSPTIRAENTALQLNAQGLGILRAQKCGSVDGNKVSGGKDADLFEFPWMALLRYDNAPQPYLCGGSLITNRHVLTAAHCVVGEKILDVRLGEYNMASDQDCVIIRERSICAQPVEDYGIESIISHPDYSITYKSNDVALIKLDLEVQFKQHIKPICLPITEAAAQLPQQRQFYVAGWGLINKDSRADVLQKATVPFVSQSKCRPSFPLTPITNNHICAGGVGIIDACQGDSGGPLFYLAPYNRSQRYVQYGIVSFGEQTCGTGQSRPGIYANVVNYMPWITENLN